jgi:hypothetical protein
MDRSAHTASPARFAATAWLLFATIALTATVMAGVILTGSGAIAS